MYIMQDLVTAVVIFLLATSDYLTAVPISSNKSQPCHVHRQLLGYSEVLQKCLPLLQPNALCQEPGSVLVVEDTTTAIATCRAFTAEQLLTDKQCKSAGESPVLEPSGKLECDCAAGHVVYGDGNSCYRLFSRGPCEPGQLLVFNASSSTTECRSSLCDEDHALWNNRCTKIGSLGCFSGENGYLVIDDNTLQVQCRWQLCTDGELEFQQSCYAAHSQGPCQDGQVLIPSYYPGSGICQASNCSQHGLLDWFGRCWRLGELCSFEQYDYRAKFQQISFESTPLSQASNSTNKYLRASTFQDTHSSGGFVEGNSSLILGLPQIGGIPDEFHHWLDDPFIVSASRSSSFSQEGTKSEFSQQSRLQYPTGERAVSYDGTIVQNPLYVAVKENKSDHISTHHKMAETQSQTSQLSISRSEHSQTSVEQSGDLWSSVKHHGYSHSSKSYRQEKSFSSVSRSTGSLSSLANISPPGQPEMPARSGESVHHDQLQPQHDSSKFMPQSSIRLDSGGNVRCLMNSWSHLYHCRLGSRRRSQGLC